MWSGLGFRISWPAWPNILRTSSSQEEGCARDWSVTSHRFSGEDGRVAKGLFARVNWKSSRGANGAAMKMEEVAGSEFCRPVDLVLLAMGFVHVTHGKIIDELGVEYDPRGTSAAVNTLDLPTAPWPPHRSRAMLAPIMIQVQITRSGGPNVLRAVEAPPPPILPGHVRIKVSAAGVNFADVQMRMGLYVEAPRTPFVPGFEVAGVIAEVGPGVRTFRRGERVMAACRFGGYTSEIVLPASQVRRTPRRLSDKEAASIPIAFMTAWISLVEMARVREGDRVLVPGAAGGVGTALVQLAARAGAQVVGAVGTQEKKDAVRALGASQVFTYAELASRRSADARDFDIVLDARGGLSLKDSLRRLAPAGRVVSYGVSSLVSGQKRSIPRTLLRLLQTPLLTPIGLAMANRGVFGLNALKLFDTEPGMSLLMKAIDEVLENFQSGALKAVVGKSFPLANAVDAHAFLQARKNKGKVVLIC